MLILFTDSRLDMLISVMLIKHNVYPEILAQKFIFHSRLSEHLWHFFFFFSVWVFFHNHSRITELQGKGAGILLTPHYHFQPLHRHLAISRAIIAESSPLHIDSSRTRTGNLWFPSAVR